MNNLEKFFEKVYQLSHLKEEEATRLVIDVIHFYRNHDIITEDEEWNWITNRITKELQRGDVKSTGYLQGLTWGEFFKNVNSELKGVEPEIKKFIVCCVKVPHLQCGICSNTVNIINASKSVVSLGAT